MLELTVVDLVARIAEGERFTLERSHGGLIVSAVATVAVTGGTRCMPRYVVVDASDPWAIAVAVNEVMPPRGD